MVHFSDILTNNNEQELSRRSTSVTVDREETRLSNSQIARIVSNAKVVKRAEGKVSFEPLSSGMSSQELIAFYEKFLEKIVEVKDRVKNDQGISPSPILSDLHYVLKKDIADILCKYAMLASRKYENKPVHDVKVALASLMIGRSLGYDFKMLLGLGLAALLQNTGMYKIPERVLQKKGRLEKNETQMVREHPKSSYKILAQFGQQYEWLAKVALQVHERADGSGYPYGLRGGEIYELSSIIGLSDVYVAMISDRPYRKKFVQSDAIDFIIKEGEELFPGKIRKAFLKQVSQLSADTYLMLRRKSIRQFSPLGEGFIFRTVTPQTNELDRFDTKTFQRKSIQIGKGVEEIGRIKKKIVRWQPSVSVDVRSYRLYWSEVGEVSYHSDHADLGHVTEIILPDDIPSFPLVEGDIEFGVTAINNAGNESDITRLTLHLNFRVPDAPQDFRVENV